MSTHTTILFSSNARKVVHVIEQFTAKTIYMSAATLFLYETNEK